ncbi:MAG: aminoglycoside phosphotransferase [Gammaproteobacteria bacterium]|nr:aminoglycoside phosphotransferase [Gammaproteobacteria bacterium]|tara:strand:+ start:521 stop:1516 length:996 start_codon:yes stop_codon:yes gene_type:complete
MIDAEDPGELLDYLIARGHLTGASGVTVTNLAGGVSNKTVLVHHPAGAWVIKQALAQLRVQATWLSDPARIHSEAAGMRALARLIPARHLTRFLFEDADNRLLAMEAVPEPFENFKTQLLSGQIEPGAIEQFAGVLGQIHAASAGDAALAREFGDRTFFESLRLAPYYQAAAAAVPDAAHFLDTLITDTRATRQALVHGDYSPKNVLVRNRTLILLDHEVIHYGDPAFDVGFATAHLLSKAHHLTAHQAAFIDATRRFWRHYLDTAGDADAERAARHSVACLLARVAGKSPLEYLSATEQSRQLAVCIDLIRGGRLADPDVVAKRFAAALV